MARRSARGCCFRQNDHIVGILITPGAWPTVPAGAARRGLQQRVGSLAWAGAAARTRGAQLSGVQDGVIVCLVYKLY
jgi:hypothetical protein